MQVNVPLRVIISGIILLALDLTYISIASSFFSKQITLVQTMPVKINYIAAIAAYIAIIFAINYFILSKDASVLDAFLLGVSIYAIYELTNYSLFRNWQFKTVVVDTLWGGILFATVVAIMKITKM
jgi:uncharacterized membrane protein